MQIKLPKEEWAERKLPDVGILPNLYLMNFMPRYRKNIMLETQKPTQRSWQAYILASAQEELIWNAN